MKRFLFTKLLLVIGVSSLMGQNISDTNVINKFIGTWRWINYTDTFEVKLIKDTIPWVMTKSVTYNIYGFHRLIENGRLIENSFSDNNNFILSEATIVGTNLNDSTLKLIVIDKYRHNSYIIYLTLEKKLTKIRWKKIKDRERLRYITKEQKKNTPKTISLNTIPLEMVLDKVCN